jgi:hypothetical protein
MQTFREMIIEYDCWTETLVLCRAAEFLSPASECVLPPRTQVEGHADTLACGGGGGGTQFRRWTETLALSILCVGI